MELNSEKGAVIKYTNVPLAQTVVQFCELKGIRNIVICAGSRNAPLTNGFVENPFFKTFSIVDERAAAFFSLGMAQQLKAPTVVVCTSGSALLNFYPAVAEAHYSDIPLVIISADRMPHRIDIGDGQTIQQKGVFEPHLADHAYLTPDVAHATATLLGNPNQSLIKKKPSPKEIEKRQLEIQLENELQINKVLNTAKQKSGPVHINVPMEEPLYGMTNQLISLTYFDGGRKDSNEIDFDFFSQQWQKATKKLILVGVNFPNSIDKKKLENLLNDPSVVLMTENTSNLRLPEAVNAIDSLIAPLENGNPNFFKTLQPEILLTFGGMVVSKKVKRFLRDFSPKSHWHVDPLKAYDTYYSLSHHIRLEPEEFISKINTIKPFLTSDYKAKVFDQYKAQLSIGKQYLNKIPFSDLKAFEVIFKSLENKWHLQLANSSTIRYAQLFDLPESTEVFCNRGTSGIDGSTATAIGASIINQNPTLLITGDLSFFYDINGLWNNYIPPNFKIILINNSGGGIFRILPGEKDTPKYDTYFETVHRRNAKSICKAFGLRYSSVKSLWGLRVALKTFLKPSNKTKLLEVKTPRNLNDLVLLNYFKAMQKP